MEEGAGGIEGVEERSRGTGGEEELAEGAGGEEEERREEEGSEGARRLDGEQLAGKRLPEVGQRAGVPSTRDEERREDEGSEEACRLDREELAGRRPPEVGFKVQRAGGPSTREDECVGGREGELDHMEIVRGGDGGQVGEGDLVEDNGGEVESEEETKEESLEGGRRRSTTGYKHNYFWCPVVDCASGPVQKMGQHLVKVHKMDRATATRTAKKKIRAPPEAIKLKLPNPARRSSGIKSISLFSTPAPSSSTPKPTSKTSGTHSKTISSLALAHSGGPFLEEFQSHLKSHAGSSSTATQLARDVGKYLYFLDQSEVNEALLLDTHPVEGYLQSLSASGMILHRLLSQKAAIHFMKLTVSCPSHHSLGLGLGLIRTTVLPHRWKIMHRYGRPTGACSTCRQSTNRTTERRPRRGATCSFKGPWRVCRTLWPLSTGSVKTGESWTHSEPTLPPSSGATFQGAGTPPASVFLPPD